MTNLKSITFTFENCDMITIDGKYIGDFLVDEIKTSFKRIACNAIMKFDTAHIIAIEIHKDANKERDSFDFWDCHDFCKHMIFDRFLEWADITHIDFTLENSEDIETEYSYTVNWVGDSDMVNDAQHGFVSESGNLYIVISDGNNIEDYFDIEMINDSEYMSFKFEMYDIGDDNFMGDNDDNVYNDDDADCYCE